MTQTDGVHTCTAGGMALSARLQEVFAQRFPAMRPRPADAVVGRKPSQWFCPGCGIPLQRAMRCAACGQSIRDQIFHIVELPPHAEEPTSPPPAEASP